MKKKIISEIGFSPIMQARFRPIKKLQTMVHVDTDGKNPWNG